MILFVLLFGIRILTCYKSLKYTHYSTTFLEVGDLNQVEGRQRGRRNKKIYNYSMYMHKFSVEDGDSSLTILCYMVSITDANRLKL